MHPYSKPVSCEPKKALEWYDVGQFLVTSDEKCQKFVTFRRSGNFLAQSIVVKEKDFVTRIPIRDSLLKGLIHPPSFGQHACIISSPHTYIILPVSSTSVMIVYGKDGVWYKCPITLNSNEMKRIHHLITLWTSFELEKTKDALVLWTQIILAHLHPDKNGFNELVESKLDLLVKALGVSIEPLKDYHPLFSEYFVKYTLPGPHQAGIEVLKSIMY